MPFTYTNTVKNTRMTATRDHFANGTLEMRDGTTVLVAFDLTAVGGSIAADTWTLAFDASTVAATAAGNADNAVIKTSAGTADVTGLTVGTSGTDVILDNTNIATGQDVTISSASVQHG